jgi:ABC-2 type transport system ATP-binding protein
MPGFAIHAEGLSKRYGDTVALDDLTLDVERGEVFGYLGPNGAGKSTTLKLLLGLIRPTSGSAEVLGIDIANVVEAHRRLAYVPGDVSLWPKLTGAESLAYLEALRGGVDTRYRDELIERFELDTSKRTRAYSKGNRQKVAIVAAFASRADLLLLDEPTSGLDPLMERQFQECVGHARERGQTVFLSSHILSEVEDLCHRVGILRDGKLVEVAAVDRLRSMHAMVLEADIAGPLPDLDDVDGVAAIERTPTGLRIRLDGPPTALVRRLGEVQLTGLRAEEESLEDIFLAYYGDTAAGSGDSVA